MATFSLPFTVYTTLPAIAIFALVLYPKPTSTYTFLRTAILAGCLACCYRAAAFVAGDDALANYTTGCMLGSICCVAWWFLFVLDTNTATFLADGVPLAKLPIAKRVRRVVELWHGSRNVGWNIQVSPNLPPAPGPSRLAFILRSLWQIALSYLFLDCLYLRKRAHIFYPDGTEGLVVAYALHCLIVATRMFHTVAFLTIQYRFLSIVVVVTGLGQPKYWPDAFGSLEDAYSIRRFWSRYWHQFLRRFVSSSGKATARLLGCTPGSKASSRVQLLAGFVVSGISHLSGDALVGREYLGCSMPFFVVQALGIMLEDEAKRLFPSLGHGRERWVRVVGYVWTFVWIMATWPLFTNWQVRAGMGQSQADGWYSVTESVLEFVGVHVA